MITKEQAREIYNHYSQIEATNNAISCLRKVAEEDAKKEPRDGVITDRYSFSGSIKLEIPSAWLQEKYTTGCTVYNISVPDAILILENHVVRLHKELEELNNIK